MTHEQAEAYLEYLEALRDRQVQTELDLARHTKHRAKAALCTGELIHRGLLAKEWSE